MSETNEYVYTTYIRTTPERLWQAITDPEFSHQYMGHGIDSDWVKGSTYAWVEAGIRIEHPDQVILEADPYRRLAFTFHTMGPDIRAMAPSLTDETIARLASERRSRVSFDIEQDGDQVKLTVVHDEFGPDSLVREMVSGGWPRKLADLKSGLEKA
jgi:uncharacterized protein YndB with AHSA1/START domain